MIAIIDYGMGNLRSVQKALEFVGYEAAITDNPEVIGNADKVVLPGVGAFGDAIKTIKDKKIDDAIYNIVRENKPFLGICLGMQMMFDKSYENGEYTGLGIMPGEIVLLPKDQIIPQIGWNSLDIKKKSRIFEGIGDKPYVYFVHSYRLKTDADVVTATCFYGEDIQVAAEKGNTFALQFHPEKSGNTGLKILKNFGGL
ncbi:MAG: imidazole glycerol phosphate synthase subunit HisH [Clostridia bacterium]|jgi:glutamine amidotransferase|nr:imidazole glycerol phosphate synthase subunit HisH [Clostridia bacterium]